MVDRSVIGTSAGPFSATVDRTRVHDFAVAVGAADPVSLHVGAARRAGHPDLLVPPTFLFCLELDTGSAWTLVDRLGVDRRHVLHGEQHFTYHRPVHAGDQLVLETRVTDVTEKRGGALKLVDRTTSVLRDGELVAELRGVIVVRATAGVT